MMTISLKRMSQTIPTNRNGSYCFGLFELLLFSFMKTRKIHQWSHQTKNELNRPKCKMGCEIVSFEIIESWDDGNDNNKTAYIAHRKAFCLCSQFCQLNKNKWLLHRFDGFYAPTKK